MLSILIVLLSYRIYYKLVSLTKHLKIRDYAFRKYKILKQYLRSAFHTLYQRLIGRYGKKPWKACNSNGSQTMRNTSTDVDVTLGPTPQCSQIRGREPGELQRV